MTRWKYKKEDYAKQLEDQIVIANEQYKKHGKALIDKVPTPWVVSYKRDKVTKQVKSKAFPQKKSTVDFVGVSHGRAIAFDAKTTIERTRFDLKNIKKHQKNYLKMHKEQGGISFFIVEFVKLNEIYYLDIDDVIAWWWGWENGGKASIPYNWFMMNAPLIKSRNGIRVDYWEVLKKYIQKGECNREKRKKDSY